MNYEIEKILGHKTIYGKKYLIIKWKGFITPTYELYNLYEK